MQAQHYGLQVQGKDVNSIVCVQEKDKNRVRGMRIMLERQTRAAAAAASSGSAAAAQAAAEAQLASPAVSSSPLPDPAQGAATGSGAASAGRKNSLAPSQYHQVDLQFVHQAAARVASESSWHLQQQDNCLWNLQCCIAALAQQTALVASQMLSSACLTR